ncbi:MAG TPA: MFS transporter [Polyangiaceae bacterium]|nr:MFS transporter [Polyangiaceae bacterium]
MRERPAVVLGTLVIAYGAFYLCRSNVESSFPLLQGAFGFSKAKLGYLSSASIVAYAVGKVLMGMLGDVIGGKRLMLLAMTGSVLATLAFAASGQFGLFVLFASVNRFFQSGGWSGAVHVVARRFERPRHGFVMGVMSTSYELGNVFALLLCSRITALLPGWRPLFLVNPLLLAAATIFLALMLGEGPFAGTDRARQNASAQESADVQLVPILASLAKRPAFWVVVSLSVLLTFLRVAFITWTTLYLYEVSHFQDIAGAIAKTATFSAAGVLAALSVGTLSDRLGPGRRAPLMAASLAVVVALVLVLARGAVHTPGAAAAIVGGIGFFLLGPYSLLAGALALDVSDKGGAATAAGIIDGAGYAGASLAGVTLGTLSETRGWAATFSAMAAVALVATLVSASWSVAALRRA